MSLKRLIQQRGNANCVGYCLSSNYSPSLEPVDGPPLDNQRSQMFLDPIGRLSKDCKQLALNRTSSISKSSGPHRKTFKIFKEDNETFGFEIQAPPTAESEEEAAWESGLAARQPESSEGEVGTELAERERVRETEAEPGPSISPQMESQQPSGLEVTDEEAEEQLGPVPEIWMHRRQKRGEQWKSMG